MGTVGTFNWVDMSTTDKSKAVPFYEGLFGWSSEEAPAGPDMTYTLFSSGGATVAGLGEYAKDQIDQGLPPVWNNYVTVSDADDTAAKAKDLGGTVIMPPTDIVDAGRMAVLQDPTGAYVSIWQDINHAGAEKFNEPVSLTWNELATRDTAGAKEFYSGLFGWTADESDMPGGMKYTSFMNSDRPAGGMYDMTAMLPEHVPANWLPYFSVEDTDATIAKCEELGGSKLNEPMDIPDVGRFVALADLLGGAFVVIQAPAATE